ncbi:M23 family metallopeptidase [Oscillibacter sp.]|uniref:M23 family metallopeptidase n=1 Tax=Oscillibacter sp. TaxID=1945593 RepID=UPI00261EDEBF|nr:M23 family metallopeptidase [Oscillibacter sp.]MDD3347985.1 M23 family metallopeptidase [Oscillibacter sp.]
MTSRQAGRRISTIAAEKKRRKTVRSGARQTARAKDAPLPSKEQQRLLQFVVCGSVFVLLVAAKLLLPSKMAQINERLSDAMRKNMDVQTVFSAVGRAFSSEEDLNGTAKEVYQAVFHPEGGGEALETAYMENLPSGDTAAWDTLREYRAGKEVLTGESKTETAGSAATESTGTAQAESVKEPQVSTLAYVLYSDQNLPEGVSMEQEILGFDYCTPVLAALSSGFGYREHPLEGEERFHYGIDLAANTGTEVDCFADGTVKAVGESSSYGKYCIVDHAGGYATLYAHCSRVVVSSGSTVSEGQKIAEVGETGMATGPHLHFELHRDGKYLNPIYYVSAA